MGLQAYLILPPSSFRLASSVITRRNTVGILLGIS
jgi:hypothetical protein